MEHLRNLETNFKAGACHNFKITITDLLHSKYNRLKPSCGILAYNFFISENFNVSYKSVFVFNKMQDIRKLVGDSGSFK